MIKQSWLAVMLVIGLATAQVTRASSPELVAAMQAVDNATSFKYKLEVPMEITPAGVAATDKANQHVLGVKATGVLLDINGPRLSDQSMVLDIDYRGNLLKNYLGETGFYFSLETVYKAASKGNYVRVTRYPDFINDYANLSKIKNVWIESVTNNTADASGVAVSQMATLDGTGLAGILFGEQLDSSLTVEQQIAKSKLVHKAFFQADIFRASTAVTNNTFAGKPVKVVKFRVNVAGIADFVCLDKKCDQANLDQVINDINQVYAFGEGELMVGADLFRITLPMTMIVEGTTVKMKIITTFTNLNDPTLTVMTPQSVISEDQALSAVNPLALSTNYDEARNTDPQYRLLKAAIRQQRYKLAETMANSRRSTIAASKNNIRIANLVDSDVTYLQTALKEYKLDAGQYPTTLVAGKPLAYKTMVYIAKVPAQMTYVKPVVCKNGPFKYTAIKDRAGKVIDYKLTYCLEGSAALITGNTAIGNQTAQGSQF